MPFRRPIPDPIEQDPETLAILPGQPLARHLGRLGIAATERGLGLEFAREVADLLWSGSVSGWDQGSHLAAAAARAGLDLQEIEAAVLDRPGHHEARLAENDRDLRSAGHWGVPTMVFADEAFFGQDRFDQLVWRLRQNGLVERER